MPSPATITVDKRARLYEAPGCPALVEIRPDEDIAAAPRLVPGSARRSHATVTDWATGFSPGRAVVICEQGRKLSEGVATWLRMFADDLEQLGGGMTLCDALYRWALDAPGETHDWPSAKAGDR